MIFAHALIIVLAITGLAVTFHLGFYVPVLLLQGSLLLRTIGDLQNPALWQWGGLLNAAAILLFFGLVAAALLNARTAVANTYKQ